MIAKKRVKSRARTLDLVGVITSAAELRRALDMNQPPDLFEIRLDHLDPLPQSLRNRIPQLPRPLIITARACSEGGAQRLSSAQRAELLLEFLPFARYLDIELRSAATRPFRALLEQARRKRIDCIISFHDFRSTPTVRSLRTKLTRAGQLGAGVFKVATRTDSPAQLQRLVEFARTAPDGLLCAVMGMGKLALKSRVLLAAAGSKFVYASLGRPRVPGQPSLAQVRSALAQARKRLF